MKRPPPPLRFLVVVVGGWTLARGAVLMWPEPGLQPARAERVAGTAGSFASSAPEPTPAPAPQLRSRTRPAPLATGKAKWPMRAAPVLYAASLPRAAPAITAVPLSGAVPGQPGFNAVEGEAAAAPWPVPRTDAPSPPRWSFSAWAFVREGGGPSLAPGGMLGGSQAGARLRYRISPAVSLTARLSTPRRTAGAEAAVGIDWRPSPRLPLRLIAERRQKLGRAGRSVFALTAYGGVSDAPLGRFRLDAYGQAGVVGADRRDLFADGAGRLSLPLGDGVKIGAGAWGAAQPGAARLDLGPSASLSLPAGAANVSLSLDWRLRVAGDARPGSGPALTLTTDF